MIIAAGMPLITIDKARATSDGGTSLIVVAAAIAQKPPMARPSTIRAASRNVMLGASATSRLEMTRRIEKLSSTGFRLKLRVSLGVNNAPTRPASEVAVTA